MSTGNFYKIEASKYFAVCMAFEDEETGESWSAQSFDYEDIYLQDIPMAMRDKKINFSLTNQRDKHGSGRFHARVIGIVQLGQVEIMLTMRNGYYEGANLDYHQISEERDTKGYQRDLDRLKAIIEEVYTRWSMPLVCTARFSNGEAIYEQVTPRTRLKSIVNDLQ